MATLNKYKWKKLWVGFLDESEAMSMAKLPFQGKFEMGDVYMTPGVQEAIEPGFLLKAFQRHVSGDWGDVCEADRKENELSLEKGFRLFSVYHDSKGTKFWLITEADRSSTMALLPNEY